jgi:sRNA-binding regulator protein Hfq
MMTNKDNGRKESQKKDNIIKNYSNPEPLNISHIGRPIVVTMITGRTESGKLTALGQYMIAIELQNKRSLLIYKSAIITISVM